MCFFCLSEILEIVFRVSFRSLLIVVVVVDQRLSSGVGLLLPEGLPLLPLRQSRVHAAAIPVEGQIQQRMVRLEMSGMLPLQAFFVVRERGGIGGIGLYDPVGFAAVLFLAHDGSRQKLRP